MNPSILNNKTCILKLKKGFTLAETVASMIALAVVSMSAQSIIMLSNKFSSKVDRTLSALEHQNTFHNLVCSSMAYPIAVQVDRTRTFFWDESTSTYLRLNFYWNATTSAYEQIFTGAEPQPATLAYHQKDDLSQPSGHQLTPADIPTNNLSDLEDVKLHKIYADSHTLITYTPSGNTIDTSKFQMGDVQENSGMIIATRCVNNTTYSDSDLYSFINAGHGSVVDSSSDNDGTFLYILNNPHRPFFFKNETKAVNQIRCCNVSTISDRDITTSCTSADNNLNKKTPVTYVIKFKSMGSADSDGNGRADIIQGLASSDTDSDADDSLTTFCTSSTNHFAYEAYNSKLRELVGVDPDDGSLLRTPTSAEKEDAEQVCLEQYYYPNLLQEFSIPISGSNLQITELPIIKNLAQELWATTFIASAFNNQASSFNLKLIDVQNNCHTSGLKRCATFPPNKSLEYSISGEADSILMADLLDVHSRSCHFRYAKQEDTSSYVPMGLQHGAAQ